MSNFVELNEAELEEVSGGWSSRLSRLVRQKFASRYMYYKTYVSRASSSVRSAWARSSRRSLYLARRRNPYRWY